MKYFVQVEHSLSRTQGRQPPVAKLHNRTSTVPVRDTVRGSNLKYHVYTRAPIHRQIVSLM